MFDNKNTFYCSDKSCDFLNMQISNKLGRGVICDSLNSEQITGCDRKIFYQITGEKTDDIFFSEVSKSFLVKKWVSIFEGVKKFEVLDSLKVFADQNYNVHAEIDIVGKMAGFPTILIIKKVIGFHKPKRRELVDAITKMWLSEVNDCFIIYDNVIEDNYKIIRIIPNENLLNGIKNKLKKIKLNKLSGVAPKRKYESIDSIECKKCFFKEKCWRI